MIRAVRTFTNPSPSSGARPRARHGPWNCSRSETTCGASASSGVSGGGSARGSRASRADASSNASGASPSPEHPLGVPKPSSRADDIATRPGTARRAAALDATRPRPRAEVRGPRLAVCAERDAGVARTLRRGASQRSRASVRSRRGKASDASLIDPRLLGDADPYVVTRWFEQRFINLDRGSKLPLGSLAPACDPSGSEGVGTGEFADRTIVAYRSRLRLKVVVPSGSSRRGGVVGDDEARTASGGKPSSAKSPPLSVKG